MFAPAIPPVHTCIYASKPAWVVYSILWWKNKCRWHLLLYLCCFRKTKTLKPIPGVCIYYCTCQHLHLYFKSNIRPLNLIWWKLECRPVIFLLQQDKKIYPHLYQVFHLLLHLSRPWFVISFKFDIINQLRATKHIFTFFPVKITDRFVYNFSIATIKMRAHATLLRDPCVGVHKCVIHTETSRP